MSVKLADATKQASADAMVDLLDVGSANAAGSIRFYSGAQNAEGDTEPTGQLVELALANPAAGNASTAGVVTFNSISAGTATATGTAQSAALFDRDRNIILTCTVTGTGGGGDIELSNTAIVSGEGLSMTSLTLTLPQDQS